MLRPTLRLVRIATLVFAATTTSAAPRGEEAIRAEYGAVWQRLVDTHIDVGETETRVERSDDLGRAWELMGDLVASTLARRPNATPADVAAALDALNPEDRVGPCPEDELGDVFCRLARFVIGARVLPLGGEPAVVAVAIDYSYFGRLLVVSREGILTSRKIHRRSEIRGLPDATTATKRFYVRGDGEDWPTSNCGGGELSVWEWRDGRLRSVVQHWYAHPREGGRFNRVFRHGRWLKLYDRYVRTVFWSCASTTGLRIWKLRIDPDRIHDFGQRLADRNLEVVDRVVRRVGRGRLLKSLATPAATAELRDALGGHDPTRTWDYYRVEPDGRSARLMLAGPDEPTLVFTIDWSRGRPVVTAVRGEGPDPPLTGGNTATSSPSVSR